MNRPKKFHKYRFLLLFGPSCLLLSFLLLLGKTALVIGHPVWLSALVISVILSVFVIYLSFLEFISYEKRISDKEKQHLGEIAHYKSLLNETNLLYTEKTAKLEVSLAALEIEKKKQNEEREEELRTLVKKCDFFEEQLSKEKNQNSDLQVALADALDELRSERQTHYFTDEKQKNIPKDLYNQHKQLRQQFEEKSLVLDQTRRRLFSLEGQLFVLKGELKEESLGLGMENGILLEEMGELYLENTRLEKEIEILEETISSLINSAVAKKSNKQIEQILEFQFETS